MFKKTRLRIFALIVATATVIITLMLSVIYIANARYNYERGLSLLESYMEKADPGPRREPNSQPDPQPGSQPDHPGDHAGMKDDHNRMFQLSTFYSVLYSSTGEPLRIDYNGGLVYSEQEILEIAGRILAGGKNSGVINRMPFLVRADENGTLVALLDNTMEMDNSNKLFLYSLLTGLVSLTLILLLAWFFSKKVVAPLEESDTKQKQFISDAGHELKTPVSVINANAELLSREIGENKWLTNIQYENEHMGLLVKQLLNLARAENSQNPHVPLDLSYLISGGALPFESVAFEKERTLLTEIEEEVQVSGDQNQLSQLVSILIDNAIQYSPPKSDILVRLHSTRHHAVLSVINQGNPLSKEQMDQIFERFYRADEARSDSNGHYGLGLAIAKAIVSGHTGKIDVLCHDGLIEFQVTLPRLA